MKMSSPDHYPDGTSVVEDRHLQVLLACRLPSTRAHGNAPPLTEHGAPVQVAVDQGLKLLPYPTKTDQEGEGMLDVAATAADEIKSVGVR